MVREALERAAKNPDFVDISQFPNVVVDLRYGSLNNILQKDVYEGYQRAILHKIAAEKFKRATELLGQQQPKWKFILYDALRPQSAQIQFWALVKGTPMQNFFADPARGSIHSFGFAIDIGLLDETGNEVDMGTPFDDLTELSAPKLEQDFLASGKLTRLQVENRKILRSVMVEAGFIQLSFEWWHFDAVVGTEVRANYGMVD